MKNEISRKERINFINKEKEVSENIKLNNEKMIIKIK